MVTTRVAAKAYKEDGDLLTIVVEHDDADPQFLPFDMTVRKEMTIEEMGQLLLDQPIILRPDPVFDGSFDIEWHFEDIGEGQQRRILDSITKL